MYKVLKSFCCSMLFVALNLCGSSAVDYLSFNNFKPFKCAKCGKQDMGTAKLIDNIRVSDKCFDSAFDSAMEFYNFTPPDVYMVFVRLDDRNTLMCEGCGREDIYKQIKSLVTEFCPGFNFQSPRQQDVENLIRNDSFIKKFPIEYYSSLRIFEDGCVCNICNKGLGGKGVEMFEAGRYRSCLICRNVFHELCVFSWLFSKHSCCPVCKTEYGMVSYNGDIIAKTRTKNFVSWVNDGCSLFSKFNFEYLGNMNEIRKYNEFRDRLKDCKTPDEFLKLLFPKKVAP